MREARNTLGLVPWPETVRLLGGEWRIPDEPVVSYGPADGEMRFAAHCLAEALRAALRKPVLNPSSTSSNGCRLSLSPAEISPQRSDAPDGDESYRIDITDHIEICANSAHGAFYGVQTLAQAVAAGQGTLPTCEITDRPALQMRGVMVDLGRLKEKDEYYCRLIDFMSQHKLNTLFLHLADDEGAPIVFESHPKLAGPYALTRESIKRLVDYAAERHVEVIPEIEVWGHAGWVTNHPEYAEISEGGPDLCTMNAKTWKFIGDLLDEISAAFPSQYIHGGCDEAIFGLCPLCKAEIEARGKDHLVGLHLKRTAEMIRERGKTPILWGDILLKYPASAEMVPQYTIINHWDYAADLSDEPVKFLMDKGFTVLGASALVCAGRAVLPRTDSLSNVENFGQIARKHKIMGLNNTIWAPQRVIADALWHGMALAAEASWSGAKPDRAGLITAFFKSFFGIDAGEDLINALETLHSIPVDVGMRVAGVWRDKEEFLSLAAPEVVAEQHAFLATITLALKTLRSYRRKAVRHRREYDALFLAGEMKRHICERRAFPGRLILLLAGSRKRGLPDIPDYLVYAMSVALARLAEQEKRIYALAEPYWDKWRYADDPKKTYSAENILEAFRASDAYMIALSERLAQAVENLQKGKQLDWDALLEA